MEQIDLENVNDQRPTNETDNRNKRIRLEDKNSLTFLFFRLVGFFLIKWDSRKGVYTIMPFFFIIAYIFWFIWPLLGLAVALYGKKVFEDGVDDSVDQVDDVMETSLFILGFAVVPAISTYAIQLITKYLPDILEDIASLTEMDVWFKTPMMVHIPSRKQKSLSSKKSVIKSARSHGHDRMLLVLPLITVVLSVAAFIAASIYGILEVVEWSTIEKEWPFYVMQFTYLTQPAITTWFCVVFIEWLRMVYEVVGVEIEYFYYTFLKSLDNDNKTTKNTSISVPLDGEKVKLIGDYADRMQEIFHGLSGGFVKFISSVNFLVCLVSSVFCTLELLRGFHLIMYMVPLAIAVLHMGLICYLSNCLMDEYDRILLVLKKMVRLERRHPQLLPYSELHILRENLLESPPQVVIFGGYPVGNGLLIAVHGFILSYAMLANDILDLQENTPNNSTLSA